MSEYDFTKEALAFFTQKVEPESSAQYFGMELLAENTSLKARVEKLSLALEYYANRCHIVLKEEVEQLADQIPSWPYVGADLLAYAESGGAAREALEADKP